MRNVETALGYIPIVLMVGGAILYFLPASWVDLPIGPSVLGTALFGLAVVLMYAGWYDRFDTEAETTEADTTPHVPSQTPGYRAIVGSYGPWILISIGAVLSWGQVRNPDRVGLVDRAPLELPWEEQPVLGFAFIISGLALFALIHIAIPFFEGE